MTLNRLLNSESLYVRLLHIEAGRDAYDVIKSVNSQKQREEYHNISYGREEWLVHWLSSSAACRLLLWIGWYFFLVQAYKRR